MIFLRLISRYHYSLFNNSFAIRLIFFNINRKSESAFDNLKDLIDQLNEKDDKKFSQFIKRNNRIPTQLIIDNVNYSFADLKLQNRNSDFFSATEDFLKTKINSKDKAELNFMHDLAENPKKSFKKSNGS